MMDSEDYESEKSVRVADSKIDNALLETMRMGGKFFLFLVSFINADYYI
jgi:hypothetical protein